MPDDTLHLQPQRAVPATAQTPRETLEAALPDVLNAPKTDGPVASLCYRPGRNLRVFPDRLVLTRKGGVEGDYEMSSPWLTLPDGSPDPRNQVSLLPSRVLDLVWPDRSVMSHPGDAIVADLDTSHKNLPVGSLLQIGTAVIGVSDVWNEGCAKWKVRYGRDAFEFVSRPDREHLRLRGIYCWIEKDGEVHLGDTVKRLDG